MLSARRELQHALTAPRKRDDEQRAFPRTSFYAPRSRLWRLEAKAAEAA